jgi:hypothetical protein
MKQRNLVVGVTQLQEGAYDATKGELTLTIIRPGFNTSKKRYYPAEMLKRDFKVFEGQKMFSDHQTDAEQRTRPEGEVSKWTAQIKKVWPEADGTLKGVAAVIDPVFKAKLDELNKHNLLSEMGVSIRAIGSGDPRKVEGEETTYIESLLKARSVDFVTYAGAGGRVEVMEAEVDEQDLELMDEAQLRRLRPDLVECIESAAKTKEQSMTPEEKVTFDKAQADLLEANRKLAVAEADKKAADLKVAESEKTAKKAAASTELTKLLTESKLPTIAQDRLKKQFEAAESTDGMAAAITAEKEYLKSIGAGKGIKNLGEADNGGEEDDPAAAKDVKLSESFAMLGLDEKQAKIAAKG